MPDYITTYTGLHFYPLNPEADKLRIEDIAHSLSLLCRGNGHLKHFFSVGHHCVNCALEAKARGYSARVGMACLLHDASEAYLSDVPRPFKKTLPSYQKLEDEFLSMVYQNFLGSELTAQEKELVKQIDDDMLYFDLTELLGEDQEQEEPKMLSDFTEDFMPFEEVECQYLSLFEEFQKAL